jgi:hypothetical protein
MTHKKTALLFTTCLMVSSCSENWQHHHETSKSSLQEERTSLDAPIPDKKLAQKYQVSLSQIGLGHAIYLRKCGECHLHVLPDQVTEQQWHVIVPKMSWNAGLASEDEKALHQYLRVASQERGEINTPTKEK